jgi:hypothetical protein
MIKIFFLTGLLLSQAIKAQQDINTKINNSLIQTKTSAVAKMADKKVLKL